MDNDRMIAAIVKRYAIRLDHDDPAFLIVELNRMALEESMSSILSSLEAIPGRLQNAGMAVGKTLVKALAAQYAEQLEMTRADLANQVTATCRIEMAAAARQEVATAIKGKAARLARLTGAAFVMAALAFGAGYWWHDDAVPIVAACPR